MLNNCTIDKNILLQLYIKEGLSLSKIAKQFGTHHSEISKLIDFYGIPRRKETKLEDVLTKEVLYDLICVQRKKYDDIAKLYNCSTASISRLKKKYGLNGIRDVLTSEKLEELYRKKRLSPHQIGVTYGVSARTVLRLCREYKIEIFNKGYGGRIILEDLISVDELKELYYSKKLSAKEIGSLYGYSYRTVLKLMEKHGLAVRTRSEVEDIKSSKTANINIDFFRTLTPDLAYLLGIMFSDGNLHKGSVQITSTDKDLIDWIVKTIQYKNTVFELKPEQLKGTFESKITAYHISFRQKEVYSILLAYGLIENKSLTVKFPSLPNEFMPHFIRGVFDGDGYVSLFPRKTSNGFDYKSGICGSSPEFMLPLAEHLNKVLSINKKCKPNKKGCYYYSLTSKKDCIKFANYMYGNENHFGINRKKKKFEKIGWSPDN